jgi:3-hydroxyisobutyrate dehydrogenase-like beta-hydroxyacid dehydrogenase
MKIGLVGWGAMGRPMADRLVAAGHDVTVVVRRPDARAEASAKGLASKATVADAVHDADVVICAVLSDEQVRSVCLGPDGVLASMRPGATLVQHTTCDPATLEELAVKAAELGVQILDAALSGGPGRIASGELTLWVGGDEVLLEQLRPVLGAYASPILHVGAIGDGQRVKLVNNALFVAQLGLAVDAVRLAGVLGIDERALLEAVPQGSGMSSAFGVVAMAGAVDVLVGWVGALMRKDLETVRTTAERAGADLGIIGTVLSSEAVARAIGADEAPAR